LQDAGAGFSGNPGAAVNLARARQGLLQTQVQQAARDAASPDPNIRQRAYATLAASGVDITPFQKNAAAQATPALLDTMTNGRQMNGAESAKYQGMDGLPRLPVSGVGDALSAVGSPELSAEYAPVLLKQQIEAQQKASEPYTLTPGSTRFVGDKQIASVPVTPNPNQPFNRDGTPNTAFQAYELSKLKAQQAPAWANYGLAKEKVDMMRAGALDPDTLGFMAQQVLAGDKSPFANLGRGQQGAQNIAALRKEVLRQAQTRGLAGSDLAALNAEFAGLQAGERTLGTRTANVEMAASEVQQLAPLALQASEAVDRTQYPTLNKILMAAEQGTGDENVVRLSVSVNGLVNTYARAISPTGNPTVSDKDHAREILEGAWSKGQFRAGVDQIGKEIAAARKSPASVRGEFRSAISGRHGGLASVPDAPSGALPTGTSLPRVNKPQAQGNIRVYNPATGKLEMQR
jgi:hypothetical protein